MFDDLGYVFFMIFGSNIFSKITIFFRIFPKNPQSVYVDSLSLTTMSIYSLIFVFVFCHPISAPGEPVLGKRKAETELWVELPLEPGGMESALYAGYYLSDVPQESEALSTVYP